jgi:hypothetical protein
MKNAPCNVYKLTLENVTRSMPKAKLYSGGCLCGSIRFDAQGPALNPHTCSCTLCQRHSGAPLVAWVEFPSSSVAWKGPGGAPKTWRSSQWSSRAFCSECGSTIGAIDDKPVVALVLGCFDSGNRLELAPDGHSYTGKRPAWLKALLAKIG